MSGRPPARRVRLWIVALLALGGLAVLALGRGGLLGLPRVPPEVTPERAGLADLPALSARARMLDPGSTAPAGDSAIAETRLGLDEVGRAQVERGLDDLRRAVQLAPRDLVVGNAYRMTVFRLRRAALAQAVTRGTLAERLPAALEREPIVFLETVRREHPGRETTLQLALAWVDQLLLFPALEITAPASVQAVSLLTEILTEDPYYVPALYARGLNYLHRPARLVWPETKKAAPDAASRDLGLAVAVGRKVGGASPELVATLAIALGDAYAREGKPGRARSWWQIAQNATRDPALLESVRRRFGWQDREMLDRLEVELQERMRDLDHPPTDLALMWRRGDR